MRIAILGYREWVNAVVEDLDTWFDGIEPVRITYAPSMSLGIPIFAVGWSNMITNLAGNDWYIFHPSRLPEYRGGSPIQHQIMDGKDWMWSSIFKLEDVEAPVDSGPLAWQSAPFPIGPESDLSTIISRMTEQAIDGIAAVTRMMQTNTLTLTPQTKWSADAILAESATRKRRTPAQSEITLEELQTLTARQLHDKIRALQDPYPNAYFVAADGRRIYLSGSHLGDSAE